MLSRKTMTASSAQSADAPTKQVRFVAKGLRSQRSRLGLSADGFGKLVGVSAQSIYNWERGTAYPRAQQLARIAALRGIGKREADARLNRSSKVKSKADAKG